MDPTPDPSKLIERTSSDERIIESAWNLIKAWSSPVCLHIGSSHKTRRVIFYGFIAELFEYWKYAINQSQCGVSVDDGGKASLNSVLASVATPVLMSLAPMIGAPTFDGLLAIKLATGLSKKSVGRFLVLEISWVILAIESLALTIWTRPIAEPTSCESQFVADTLPQCSDWLPRPDRSSSQCDDHHGQSIHLLMESCPLQIRFLSPCQRSKSAKCLKKSSRIAQLGGVRWQIAWTSGPISPCSTSSCFHFLVWKFSTRRFSLEDSARRFY